MSLAGVVLVAAYLYLPSAGVPSESSYIVWALFVSLCLMGTTATFLPHRCNPSNELPQDLDPSRIAMVLGVRLYHGHHVPCTHFQGHEHNVRGRSVCAGCSGLLVGAMAAVFVVTLRFVYGWSLGGVSGYAGLLCVVLGLIYNPLRIAISPFMRSLVNVFFVLGFALTLSSVDGTRGGGSGLVVVGLCVFWMFTRIQLSSLNHDRICDECGDECWKGEPSGPH